MVIILYPQGQYIFLEEIRIIAMLSVLTIGSIFPTKLKNGSICNKQIFEFK